MDTFEPIFHFLNLDQEAYGGVWIKDPVADQWSGSTFQCIYYIDPHYWFNRSNISEIYHLHEKLYRCINSKCIITVYAGEFKVFGNMYRIHTGTEMGWSSCFLHSFSKFASPGCKNASNAGSVHFLKRFRNIGTGSGTLWFHFYFSQCCGSITRIQPSPRPINFANLKWFIFFSIT